MKKLIFAFYISLLLTQIKVNGQVKNYHFRLEGQTSLTSPSNVPFWMWAGQYGSVPLSGPSFNLLGSVYKDYDTTKSRLFDWGAGVNSRANVGSRTEAVLLEAYGKVKLGVFELKGGRFREISGLVDTTLSSGAFAISNNALGIPRLQLGIPEFYSLPILGKLFAFKGNFAHGWIGRAHIQMTQTLVSTYFHQKSLYGRFGKPHWRLKLYGGFNHQAFWGNAKAIYGNRFDLSLFEEYQYNVLGKVYGGNSIGIEMSKLGNHLGSLDVGLEYNFGRIKLLAYRQNIYDVGALYYLANILDGINGVSIVNNSKETKAFYWQKLLFEILYTKNQAGYEWSRVTPSGDEDYYNSYLYSEGWSYKGLGLGNPLLSTRTAVRQGQTSDPVDYFINNRVLAFHFGMALGLKQWRFQSKATYSQNYGTFKTSSHGHSTGSYRVPPQYGLFKKVDQFSLYLEGERELWKGFNYGFVAAWDHGRLYDNSMGLLFKFSKSFK